MPNGWPLTWKVLFVEPVTDGHAPLASEYHPAPVLGGAWVSNPPPPAFTPLRSSSLKPGVAPAVGIALDEVLAQSVGGEEQHVRRALVVVRRRGHRSADRHDAGQQRQRHAGGEVMEPTAPAEGMTPPNATDGHGHTSTLSWYRITVDPRSTDVQGSRTARRAGRPTGVLPRPSLIGAAGHPQRIETEFGRDRPRHADPIRARELRGGEHFVGEQFDLSDGGRVGPLPARVALGHR